MNTSIDIKPLITAFLDKLGSTDEGVLATIDLAVLVANADGKIDKAERAALTESLATILGGSVAPVVAHHLVSESRRALEAAGVEARAKAIGAALKAKDATAEGLRVALAVAYASEGLSDAERERIAIVASAAGAPDTLVDELSASMKPA